MNTLIEALAKRIPMLLFVAAALYFNANNFDETELKVLGMMAAWILGESSLVSFARNR